MFSTNSATVILKNYSEQKCENVDSLGDLMLMLCFGMTKGTSSAVTSGSQIIDPAVGVG